MNSSSDHLWRRKLNAYLHDTPDKTTDIASHEFRAAWLKALDQFSDEESFDKSADWAASAADRLPFPHPKRLRQSLDELERLPHALGEATVTAPKFGSAMEALETSQKTRPFLLDGNDPRADYLCAWRFWRNWASSADARFPFLPADTRIPDHSIWHHLGVTSALQSCQIPCSTDAQGRTKTFIDASQNPRLLLFSLGPVQPFIASARSTRDLWSGSYLLSYLISTALGEIARELGPDHVIFPNLLDQPLLDLQLREIFEKVTFSENTVWKGLGYQEYNLSKLLTPSLPNRFLAVLPATLPNGETCEEFAAKLGKTIQKTLSDIAGTVAREVGKLGLQFERDRFDEQTSRILDLHWQTLAIPEGFEEVWKQADELLPPDEKQDKGYQPRAPIAAIRDMIQQEDCKPQYDPSPTSAWGLLNALLQWLHDGTKAQRPFEAWSTGEWKSGTTFNKDSLNGKEEAVLIIPSGNEDAEKLGLILGMSKGTFKANELLGASTLIKRLWWHCYLPDEIGISASTLKEMHPMPNTHAIAKGDPFADSDEYEESEGEKYFAILALDGDEMGKWISGSKSPKMRHCLSPEALKYYEEKAPDFLEARRAITPAWHQQFSEALGNFSFHCAQRIVEAFDGRLLYAGGDDVLAMLPAKDAVACARALRAAFRGEKDHLNKVRGKLIGEGKKRRSDRKSRLFNCDEEGYLRLHEDSGATFGESKGLLSDPVEFSVLLPGPATDVSVGIAIAHQKSPLQDVVRAAQSAEKRAKKQLNRAALAITVMKRSGEILEWGCKWSTDSKKTADSAGYLLLQSLITDLLSESLKGRFPHKVEALLVPYLNHSKSLREDESFDPLFGKLLLREVEHVLTHNDGGHPEATKKEDFTRYWEELGTLTGPNNPAEKQDFNKKLSLFINLLRTAAWSVRNERRADEETTYALNTH
ncbi:type III-B CRISPR-associated protein Cas10/Cmr2 [Roseibacillus ishigakijimensis]|uniref:Type III-B CRISPR-associated protein Cas10/Cmr2 n=1 Tax=Roseibacillus ishigakijimensis TaxID=454146 RepID=A0A934RNV3_9BACT|nr:type III-B CRISPR-associated protein Cas10/Cmr2 [Roseibacillus ishigakijimensis]MBK1832768.1 type III-B CRISPR-associated protein Cas10/Cmr2 [Roseibacillus ishigakijimensis]